MMQTQSSVEPALAALLQTAQMVTPDQTPTIAAQVAQAAAQKMQPRGIMQGMPQARQEFQQAAPSMMRNMQQQQVQQMVKQAMQPQPAGIEGLPAPNLQGMAEGGVVGYNGEKKSFVESLPEESGLRQMIEWIKSGRKRPFDRPLLANLLEQQTTESPAPKTEAPQASYDHETRVGLASKPAVQSPPAATAAPVAAPVSRPPAVQQPSAATNVPPGGIASAIERPTIEGVMQGVRMAMGQDDQYENKMRDIARREEAKRAGMPDLNAQGIAALQEAEKQRQADLQRGKFHALFEGWKGNTSAYGTFKEASRQAELQNKMAIMKFQEAQQARELGEFDRAKALEKEVQAHKDKQAQIEQAITSSAASLAGHTYTADVSARERAADRAQQAQIEGARLKQQAEQNGQMQLASRINAANMTVAAAIEKMDKDLEKKYGQVLSYKKMMPPDQFSKNPGFVENYQQYLAEREEKYRVAVEPAVRERDRLAAQVMSGQDLSKWGEPQVKSGR